ncbi:MAG TPA: hypothetical protein VG738_11150 [Chitinophagaceae bacterium]|nr:hypothetical protein [Chitinophagaceae bacterium]
MDEGYRDNQRKGYMQMRSVADFTMAIIILSIGLVMVAGDKLGIPELTQLLLSRDALIRYMFGGICLLYGGFRLYRAIKKDY